MDIAGKKLIMKALMEEGVDTVFAYPGGMITDIMDEMYKQDNLKVVLPRHEQALVHEAEGYARSTDIAARLDVTKPSVSIAMKKLRENGYITMDQDSLISLTETGYAIARRIYDRHKALTRFLIRLGVDEKIAREDACKIEHDISEETFAAIRAQMGEP